MANIKNRDWKRIEEAISQHRGRGYVLDFSDPEFSEFFDEEFKIDIDDERYQAHGTSKGKRLRGFCELEHPSRVAQVLRALWKVYEHEPPQSSQYNPIDVEATRVGLFSVVEILEGDDQNIRTDVFEKFSRNETLSELIAAIERDIAANTPQAALDRLHTYCMKKFRHLLEIRGENVSRDEPLHSRVGRYRKTLLAERDLHEISDRAIKSSISLFEAFNDVRNHKSFAHDNDIISAAEGRLIFESISAILRFIKAIDVAAFEE